MLSLLYDGDEMIRTGKVEVVGMERKHVFDMDNGLRVIIAYERERGVNLVHFSFSQNPSALVVIPINVSTMMEFAQQIAARLLVITDIERTPRALHLYFKPEQFGL